MKKTLLTILLLSLVSSVCFPQAVVRREKKKDKTEQTTRKPPRQKPQTSKPAVRKPERKKPDVKVSAPDGYINGHGYVDLGLPSGTKWATCNVGATSPEDYGDYFAWGETSTKSSYTSDNSLNYGKSLSELKSAGIIGPDGNLTPSYDAASANWGSLWRMPTKAEMEELVNKCQWIWTTKGGKNGYNVTGPNGRAIFLPAAGYYIDYYSLSYPEIIGDYWTSTDSEGHTLFLDIQHDDQGLYTNNFRNSGNTIRPVSK